MNDSTKCPQCGKPVVWKELMGLCPDCMLKAGLGSMADATAPGRRAAFVPPTVAELAGKFPQLDILELIGSGGMGAVYKARQKALDRFVALKILPPDVSRAPSFAERFVREAKVLAKLNHPNIVTLYEFGETEGALLFSDGVRGGREPAPTARRGQDPAQRGAGHCAAGLRRASVRARTRHRSVASSGGSF